MEKLNTECKLDLEELEGLAEVGGNDKEGRIALSTALSIASLITEATNFTFDVSQDFSWWAC